MNQDNLSSVETTADDVAYWKALKHTDEILARLLDQIPRSNPFEGRTDLVSQISADVLASRTLYFNKAVTDFIQYHHDNEIQVVVVAAGLDTRAYQPANHPSAKTVTFFEVDLPAFSTRKQKLLQLAQVPTSNTQYISHDILSGDIVEKLKSYGFDSNKATLVTVEGISMYLPKAKFQTFLQQLNQITTVQVEMDWFEESVINMDQEKCGELALLAKIFEQKNAKWTTFYTPSEIANYLNKTAEVSTAWAMLQTQQKQRWADYNLEFSICEFGSFK